MSEGTRVLVGFAVLLLVIYLAGCVVIPYKTCPVCHGRGHCTFCRFNGKVLKLGAHLVRPDLRRK